MHGFDCIHVGVCGGCAEYWDGLKAWNATIFRMFYLIVYGGASGGMISRLGLQLLLAEQKFHLGHDLSGSTVCIENLSHVAFNMKPI